VTRPQRLRVIVEADGGARGNPGPAGYGALVREAATGEVLVEISESIGVATNNVAEYSGLVAGLSTAADLGAVEVEVRMDSRLVVEQMSGRWQIRNPGLRPLAAQAAALARRFESVRFTWVPREQNVAADRLANSAMDAAAVEQPAGGAARAPGNAGGVDGGVGRWAVEQRAAPSWAPRPAAEAARLVLVRHGQTAMNAQGRYSGRGDVPLTPHGHEQASAIASRVSTLVGAHGASAAATTGSAAEPDARETPVPVVVSSPLSRCRRTAEAVAALLGEVPVTVEPAFIECDFGAWEGLTFADVRDGWPDEFAAWLGSAEVAPPGGESFAAVASRVRPAVAALVADHAGRVVVVVTHVTPIKLMLRDALAATDALLHRLYLDPAGISVLDAWNDGSVAVRTVNDTAHLA
jgi:probable phosphoglycerate mutase